jgi:hypothetical protein
MNFMKDGFEMSNYSPPIHTIKLSIYLSRKRRVYSRTAEAKPSDSDKNAIKLNIKEIWSRDFSPVLWD